jgi:hypothetical protein
MYTELQSENLKERCSFVDLRMDERIILNGILKRKV